GDPAVGMVAGLTLIPDSPLVDQLGVELDVTLAAYNRLRHRRPDAAAGRLAVPCGGAAAYRRSAFEAVGGFDERLFAYGEDVDLGLRLHLAGWQAREARDARAVHLGGASAVVGSPFQRRLAGVSRGFLLRRYGVLRSRAWFRALLVELAVVGWGLVRHRTTVPITARVQGWRLAGSSPGHLPVPPGVTDPEIGLGLALRRLAGPA
nr:glycosyltransferase family 2 protein [Solirubrobacterales bacterium]